MLLALNNSGIQSDESKEKRSYSELSDLKAQLKELRELSKAEIYFNGLKLKPEVISFRYQKICYMKLLSILKLLAGITIGLLGNKT